MGGGNKPFKNVLSDINVKNKKSSRKQTKNGFGVLSQTKIYSPGTRPSKCELSGDWVFSQMEFIPPWVKKKRREMPPWIDEWQMSHFHLWGSECSHSSAVMSRHDWNVFFCMSLCEINKSERKEKRGWECNDEILAAIFFYPSNVPLNGPMPSPFIQPESQLFHPALQHGRCVSRKKTKHGSPPLPRQLLRSFHKCNEGRGCAALCKWTCMYIALFKSDSLKQGSNHRSSRATVAPKCKMKLHCTNQFSWDLKHFQAHPVTGPPA